MLENLKYYIKRFLFNRTSPFILYHSVEFEEDISGFSLSDIHNVSPEIFEEQIEFIQQHHKFIFVDEFFDLINKGKSLKGLACLTFDDGYLSILKNCATFLAKKNIPFTVFLNKKAINGSYLWRDMIRIVIQKELIQDFLKYSCYEGKIDPEHFYLQTKSGIVSSQKIADALEGFFDLYNIQVPSRLYLNISELKKLTSYNNCMVGNHTVTHLVLADLNVDQLRKEITDNYDFLRDNFSKKKISKVFSIPFGGTDTFNLSDMSDVLINLNYKGFLTTEAASYFPISGLQNKKSKIPGYARFLPTNKKFSDSL